ncbi:helix-turn-helix domain-containing protein [Streptomyces triticiradicis]|uniref:Helix-turn-helix domain-containing protein n=1 Tax=Streptomyces triticiradicis TaxID=2651189 RepID=A0A7J5DGB0_9ACTN|nr:helix-turn-helix domain-containing protein [Streptomyces triticiradicis]KAB1987791.1 helix-turn-helix domain-containing protein [Streptomyces triticiradicis]
MDTQNLSAPPCAQSRVAADKSRTRRPRSGGGLIHENTRHTERFTVIGNHLTQHPELSGLAIGLGVHIQSPPTGARVDIKTLTTRFPEGSTRIAAALRELEVHGYLRRTRERAPGGRIVTRTVFCDRPGHRTDAGAAPEPARPTRSTPAHVGSARTGPENRAPERPEPGHPASGHPGPRAPRKPLPAVPQPACTAPGLLQAATDLRRHDPCLLLSACDTAHLAPGVAAWLERDVSPSALRHALTSDLPPEGLRRPAALLAHRLAAQLPPPPPFREPVQPPQGVRQHPFQTCDGCDRAFRAPEPGRCRDCRAGMPEAA